MGSSQLIFYVDVEDTAQKKRPRAMRGLCNNYNQSLLLDNVLCGRSFGTVDNVEGHA
jgi:hypothetical protein